VPNDTRLKAEYTPGYVSRQDVSRSLATWNCGVADTTIREPPPPWKSLCRVGAVPAVKVRSVIIMALHSQQLHRMLSARRPVIHEFAAKAREACGDAIEEIILFGSVARGDDRPDSDIDILVITSREDFRLREYLTGLAFDLLMLSGERLSVKVISRTDLAAHRQYPFIRHVLHDGVAV